MSDPGRIPFHFTFFLAVGITSGFFFDFPKGVLLLSLAGILALLALRQWVENRNMTFSPVFFALTGAFFVFLGSYLTTKIRARGGKDQFSHFYNSGDLVGIVLQNRISKKKGAQRFQARIFSLGSRPCEANVYVKIEIDTQEGGFLYGDTLWTRNSLYRIGPPINPGAFDFKEYAARKNIFYQLYLNRGEFVMKPGNKKGLLRSSIQLNRDLQRALEKVLKEPGELSVAKALLLGDRNEIPDELLNRFKGAGAMHILAISGLHVGIVHVILMFLSRPLLMLRRGRILRVVLILSGLWSYALITGMAVSALRSVSMFTLLTLGIALNRKTGLLNNLVNSAFVLLILNPMLLFDVGFQLSYSALTGIGLGAIWIEKRDRREKPVSKIQKYFLGLILVSCSAQLGVMPLSLYYFKQFSGLFLVSSILLLPVLGITLIFGYSVLAASMIFEAQWFVYEVFQAWLKLMTKTIEWLGGVDELIFAGIWFPFSFLILMGSGFLLFTMGYLKRIPTLIIASCICLISMQVIWIGHRANLLRNEKLLVFHKRGESLVVRRKGPVLELKKYDTLSQQREKHLEDYSSQLAGNFLIQPDREGALLPIQLFYSQKSLVCVIDKKIDLPMINALGSLKRHPDIVVFSNAPSFNLERLLRKIRPGIVVADGSNHRGFVRRCRATCQSLGIEFHGTYEKGAFLYPK